MSESGHRDDPDAQDLPPGTVLPEAGQYRKDQLAARATVDFVALLVVLLIWLFVQRYEQLVIGCAAAVGGVLVFDLIRLVRARRRAARSGE